LDLGSFLRIFSSILGEESIPGFFSLSTLLSTSRIEVVNLKKDRVFVE
jgi:hypothetical protein